MCACCRGSLSDNEHITRSGAERKGWPRVMVTGLARNGAGVHLVNHRLTHCLGGAVSWWVQSMHRFSTLNNSTIRDRVPRGEIRSPFSGPLLLLCKITN